MHTTDSEQSDLSDQRVTEDSSPSPQPAPAPLLEATGPPTLGVIVLAGGRGSRFVSATQKVSHPVGGVPMVAHVVDEASSLNSERLIVVTGFDPDSVLAALGSRDVDLLDGGDSNLRANLMAAIERAAGCSILLLLSADRPLMPVAVMAELVLQTVDAEVALALPEERIDEDDDPVLALAAHTGWLRAAVETAPDDTPLEVIGAAASAGRAASVFVPPSEAVDVDTRADLAEAEQLMRARVMEQHMLHGVTIVDPLSTYIDASVTIEQDVRIEPNCYLYGDTIIAGHTVIGPGSTLRNAAIGARTRVEASVIEDSRIGEDVKIGPFSHVRGGADIGDGCYLGNYAEVKNSRLGRGVKMHHFSYVGDADVGDDANIAAGVITCNYDGVRKHRTVIGAGAFVGCDTMLVAPVEVGAGALTGAGSVVNRDVPPGAKAIGMPARIRGDAPRPQGE
jgi:bifunctional UDP-N-acetylglucosamine pyrophosphorylase/glucosamine-1-phosphate N-acetyltransferase